MSTAMAPSRLGRRSLLGNIGLYGVMAVIGLIAVFPFFWMVITSLKPDADIFTRTPQFLPTNATLDRYDTLFEGDVPKQFVNSLIVAGATTVLSAVIASMAGYVLARYKIPFRRYMVVVILSMQMLPQTVLVVPLFKVFKTAHLLDTYQGLILSHLALTVGLGTYMLRSFYLDVPIEIEEAAMVDGANRMQVFRHVVLPLVWPGLAASSVYAFITSWNELMFSATFMQQSGRETLPIALQRYFSSYYSDWGGVMAASVMFTVPVVIFFVAVQKRLTTGLMAGAVKG